MEQKINEIWIWMGCIDQYKNGVTNKDVAGKFGSEYKEAWKKVKTRYSRVENGLFYENGKWHRWFKNHLA